MTYWNEKGNRFEIREFSPKPMGAHYKNCPKCRRCSVIAAVVRSADGKRAIDSSDDYDPNFACTSCGYWWD